MPQAERKVMLMDGKIAPYALYNPAEFYKSNFSADNGVWHDGNNIDAVISTIDGNKKAIAKKSMGEIDEFELARMAVADTLLTFAKNRITDSFGVELPEVKESFYRYVDSLYEGIEKNKGGIKSSLLKVMKNTDTGNYFTVGRNSLSESFAIRADNIEEGLNPEVIPAALQYILYRIADRKSLALGNDVAKHFDEYIEIVKDVLVNAKYSQSKVA